MNRFSIFLVIVALFIVAVGAVGGAFLLAHPKCELCGRRYGPFIAHNYRHPTTKPIVGGGLNSNNRTKKQQAMDRARATAPVINSLPPLTDANKDLTLSLETLVGRWESQDGSRSPLVFREDGSCDVGFIKEGGVWLISKGNFEINEDRVTTRTKYKTSNLGQYFTFARGVLYAPKGPSPRVVWKRIGPLTAEDKSSS